MRTPAGQILRLRQRLARSAVADLPGRVAQISLRLAEGGPGQQPPNPNKLTQQALAEPVGTARHAIAQTLMPFAERGHEGTRARGHEGTRARGHEGWSSLATAR
jgi:hypothetical protein